MNFRLTTVLIGAVLLVGTVLLVRTFFVGPAAPDTLLVGLGTAEAKDIDEVVIERPDSPAMKFKRFANDDWELTEPVRTKANGPAIKSVVSALLKAKPTVFADISSNPAVHGLQPPSLKVTLRQGEQKAGTLNIGNVTIGGRESVVFVTTTANPDRPVAVRRSDLDALFRADQVGAGGKAGDLAKWTADYRTTAVFPSDSRAVGEDVTALRLELPNKGGKVLALARPLGAAWRFDTPANWGDADMEGDSVGNPATFTGVRRLLGALTSVAAAGPADFIDSPKDLKEYGLDAGNPDLVKVEMKTRDGQAATVLMGKRETAPAPAMPGAPATPNSKVYVQIVGQKGVIRATCGDLSGLANVILDPAPLRDRTLISADRAKVDGLDIQLAGQPAPTKLRLAGGLWSLYGGPGDPQPAFTPAVDKILDAVLARRSIKDFPPANPQNFAAVSVTVSVWTDGFNAATDPKAEPTKKAEPIKLEFGRRDGDSVYVRRTLPGLPPNEFTIPLQLKVGGGTEVLDPVLTVTKGRLDLLNPSLPSFSDSTPVRITVTGANNYTLARDEKPDPSTRELLWRFDPSDSRKGQVADGAAVADLLGLLGTSQAAFGRFVDEDPAEAKLAEFGLAPPRLKVVVGLGASAQGEKERGFEFGKDTADPDKVYMRVAGKKAVFTLQRRAFDRSLNPDLRDRALFRIVHADLVNKVELKGWGDLGAQQELVFEKKDGVWTATKSTIGGLTVDSAKVSAFVDLIARMRAKTFEKTAPQTAHGFGDPKQLLHVVMRWPGGAMAMNLGASPDNGGTYYGWSAWLPPSDSVFTTDGSLLKPFKDRPGAFAK